MAFPAVAAAPVPPQQYIAYTDSAHMTPYVNLCGQHYTGGDIDFPVTPAVTNSNQQRVLVFVQNLSGGTLAPGDALNFTTGGWAAGVQNCPAGSAIRGYVPGWVNGNQTNTIPNQAFFLMVKEGPTTVATDGTPIPAISDVVVGATSGQVRASFASAGQLQKSVLSAAGAALSGTTTATDMGGYTFAANTLEIGDVIRGKALVTMTSFNSTNTLALVLTLTPQTSGAAIQIVGPTAYTGSANDIQEIDFELVVRTIGTSGTFVGAGFNATGGPGAIGTISTATTRPWALPQSAIDTTQGQRLSVIGTWSNNSGSNSGRLDIFDVTHGNVTGVFGVGGRSMAAATGGGTSQFLRVQAKCLW
jgi:hypothetical protein